MDLRQVFVTSKKEEKSETGVKIKEIRLMRGVKVTKIAGMVGVNEACVRNYEIAYRNPDRESLSKIADCLGVPVETLVNRQLFNNLDAIHTLFEIAEKYDFEPTILPNNSGYVLKANSREMNYALGVWYNKLMKYRNGNISKEDFQSWLVSFPYECENEKIMGRTLNDVSLRMFDDTLEKWQEFIKDKEYGVLLLDEALREYMRNKERQE